MPAYRITSTIGAPFEARAGEDESNYKYEPADNRVERPLALAPSGEMTTEHEAGGRQRHEGEEQVEVVEGAMPSVPGQSVESTRRVAAYGIGDKESRNDQAAPHTPTSNGPQIEPPKGRSARRKPTAKATTNRLVTRKLAVCVQPESPRASELTG